MPALAFGKPLRRPLLYDPTDPECLHNGIYYSRLAGPAASSSAALSESTPPISRPVSDWWVVFDGLQCAVLNLLIDVPDALLRKVFIFLKLTGRYIDLLIY